MSVVFLIFNSCSLFVIPCVLTASKLLYLWCFQCSIHAHFLSIPCVLTGCKLLCLWYFQSFIHVHSLLIPCVPIACKLLCLWCFWSFIDTNSLSFLVFWQLVSFSVCGVSDYLSILTLFSFIVFQQLVSCCVSVPPRLTLFSFLVLS